MLLLRIQAYSKIVYLEDADETTGNEPRSNALPDETDLVDEEIGGY